MASNKFDPASNGLRHDIKSTNILLRRLDALAALAEKLVKESPHFFYPKN